MMRKLAFSIGGVALAIIVISLALLAVLRVKDQYHFQKEYKVQTFNGTNYVIQLSEVTVGKVESGCVVMVYARVQNPNPVELTLKRDWFVLVDANKNYYQPVASGTQSPVIKVPANGVAEKEALSYVVEDGAFEGTAALCVGHRYFTLIKSERPYHPAMKIGEFKMFKTLDW